MVNCALTCANRGLHFLFGTGNWRLLPHEMQIVVAVANALPDEEGRILKGQIEQRFFVERSNPRINLLRSNEGPKDLRLGGKLYADSLFRVRLRVRDTTETANVTFLNGWIFSIETRQVRQFYSRNPIQVLGVDVGQRNQTLTRAIDRLEHGK